MDIRVEKTTTPAAKPADESKLGFGSVFTDHMFIADWDKGIGWHDARVVPFGPISFHPASSVFHYGAEIFEGLKAYRTADGEIQLFRPLENARRMRDSANRMAMPALSDEDFMQALELLLDIDRDWVPHGEGTSLYIRPFTIGDNSCLGVHGISQAHFYIILSPSGSYYASGIKPVKIMIESEDVRAVRGGTGFAKCGGNYGASLRAGDRAEAKGYSQVLWLDGVERKYIEEVGAMNIMFKINGVVVTPMLNGSILPGITRKSILDYLRHEGMPVEERLLSVDELVDAMKNGTLEEAWGCGTAAVVSPVGWLEYDGTEYCINNGEIGPLTQKLYNALTDIQWGRAADPFQWVHPVPHQ